MTVKAREQAKLYENEMGGDAATRQLRAAAPKCRSCNEPIRWITTSGGKHMPVDYDPHDGGNILLWPDGRSKQCEPGGPREGIPAEATLHYSHFATCPHADRHRKT